MSRPDRSIDETADTQARRAAMSVLAAASAAEIAQCFERIGIGGAGDDIAFAELRPAETGLVMLRGRIGGKGAPFNAGEATVTRAAIRLASGETGFGYILGRDREKARLAALCDALWQNDAYRPHVEQHVLTPLRNAQRERRNLARAQTAATRVDFFTLVRGEDER